MVGLNRMALMAGYARFRVQRRFSGAKNLFDQAQKTWTVAPPETIETPPSIVLDGEFDRIREVEQWTTPEVERRRMQGGPFDRPAVTGYEYKDAILYQGSIIAAGAEKRILPYEHNAPRSKEHPVETIDEGALAGSYLGLMYFGHWLKDDAPLSLLAEEYGTPFSPSPPAWHAAQFRETHIGGYIDFLDVPWRQAENVRCKKLVLFDDEDFTTHKGARLERLRARAMEKLGAPVETERRVFIKRGIADKGVRRFGNEADIAARLKADGFSIVDPSKMNVIEIATALHGAALVVAAEGSHQVHSIFTLPKGAGLLAISAPDRFCTVNKRWTDLLGLRYGFMVGDPAEEGFTVDYDRLRRTIDLFGV